MRVHFLKELEKLKKKILLLSAMVEEGVRKAVKALENRDGDLATNVIKDDHDIDVMEVDVEEECLKILALYQPVAGDLRMISAVIKINNDLERIGDEAVNIAERVITISKRPHLRVDFDYGLMAGKAELMLKNSLDALVNLDADLASRVCKADDEVDEMKRENYDKIKNAVKNQPERVAYLINLMLVARHLERIADHATNIAEEVIYMINGEITRHKNFKSQSDDF
ncbi:MAG: phosphate signaling complex protein PhoU [Deltaproteobacteria bacterium]|nr:phosphate signaling complex protein PhoU [Deltaproteobacteria bacterium]